MPNHTSDRHPWFAEALASAPGSAARARYIFRDGTGPDGSEPPSDWLSHFGGPAWTRITEPDGRGQWYCHLFAPEQPDLNWDNPEVREDFKTTLRFWADRGVDGYRVDVAHALAKDLSEPLRSKPELYESLGVDGNDLLFDRDEVHEIYAEWRAVFNAYDPPRTAVAEASPDRSAAPSTPGRPGSARRSTSTCSRPTSTPTEFRDVITFCLDGGQPRPARPRPGCCPTTTWSGTPRATRCPPASTYDEWLMSDGALPLPDEIAGLRRARAATLLMLALPGSSYLYQGEELGLHEVSDLPAQALQDPIWQRTLKTKKGRDGCRVPLPWTDDGDSFGFGSGPSWLPQPAGFSRTAVAAQTGRPGVDAGALPGGAAGPPSAADRRGAELGADRTARRCCTSSGRAAGTASPTSAPSRAAARGRGPGRAAPPSNGVLPGESTVWLTEWPRRLICRAPGCYRRGAGGSRGVVPPCCT